MLNDTADPAAPEAATIAEAERLLRQGEPLLAYNMAETGLQQWPGHIRLHQLLALALARSGDTQRANTILEGLAAQGIRDSETLGGLARTHKDLGLAATDPTRRLAHLEASYRLYEQAYAEARTGGPASAAYYTGINAATLAALRGDVEKARLIAAEVITICESAQAAAPDAGAEYWRQATLGEAALILGDTSTAAKYYLAAIALAPGRFGDFSSTRRQARLLAAHLPVDDSWIADVLRIPPVLVFTGHMVDAEGRQEPRFPPHYESAVRQAINATVQAIQPIAAYGSAACGADILCLEVMQEQGIEIHVVLPFPPEEFRKVSVDVAPGNWGPRFDRLLATANSVTITSDHRASGSNAPFEYSNLVMTGLGQLRAHLLDTSLRGLGIWDGAGRGGAGGSASMVAVWERTGIAVDHVYLPGGKGTPRVETPPQDSASGVDLDAERRKPHHDIKALLFADAVGYSKLSEDQIPAYVTGFLGAVAALNRRTRYRCEHVETAGDGLYMVFAEAVDAAHYALELSTLIGATDWTAQGLPANFNLRIALHCGPVYCGLDPITDTPLFTGPHTSRAARIEPITPPGQVYASSAFAAVVAAKSPREIVMRHVGQLPLAKSSGTLTLYHLQAAV